MRSDLPTGKQTICKDRTAGRSADMVFSQFGLVLPQASGQIMRPVACPEL